MEIKDVALTIVQIILSSLQKRTLKGSPGGMIGRTIQTDGEKGEILYLPKNKSSVLKENK